MLVSIGEGGSKLGRKNNDIEIKVITSGRRWGGGGRRRDGGQGELMKRKGEEGREGGGDDMGRSKEDEEGEMKTG